MQVALQIRFIVTSHQPLGSEGPFELLTFWSKPAVTLAINCPNRLREIAPVSFSGRCFSTLVHGLHADLINDTGIRSLEFNSTRNCLKQATSFHRRSSETKVTFTFALPAQCFPVPHPAAIILNAKLYYSPKYYG